MECKDCSLRFTSPIPTENPSHLAYHKSNQDADLPIGQVNIRMRYLHHKSEWFSLYLPTPEEFRNVTENAGWKITVDLIDTPFHYIVLDKGICTPISGTPVNFSWHNAATTALSNPPLTPITRDLRLLFLT